jgi:hypothetical protein
MVPDSPELRCVSSVASGEMMGSCGKGPCRSGPPKTEPKLYHFPASPSVTCYPQEDTEVHEVDILSDQAL